MRRLLPVAVFMLLAVARAENPPRYATSDRIITIEQWGSLGRVAIAWAILPRKIIVYEIEGASRDKLLRIVSLDAKDETNFRRLASRIPHELRGKVWFPRGTDDGIMMRISFTDDGRIRDYCIEVQNHWRPELAELIAGISEKVPAPYKITFKEKLSRFDLESSSEVVAVPWREYHAR